VDRRSFIAGTLILLAAPLNVEAQQAGKVARVAYLSTTSPSTARISVEAFRQGLRELGYAEGRDIAIEYRWVRGQFERPCVTAVPGHGG
jgi:putative ABC transport system substrate-binding protein